MPDCRLPAAMQEIEYRRLLLTAFFGGALISEGLCFVLNQIHQERLARKHVRIVPS